MPGNKGEAVLLVKLTFFCPIKNKDLGPSFAWRELFKKIVFIQSEMSTFSASFEFQDYK